MRASGLCLAAFLVCGTTASAQDADRDDRVAVMLKPNEQAYVFEQMRLFVASIQTIVAGLSEGDHALASEAAAARGLKRNANDPAFPPTLGAKLPAQWKQLGGGMRQGFDVLSQSLVSGDSTQQSLAQLSALMTNCIACHATYRITIVQP